MKLNNPGAAIAKLLVAVFLLASLPGPHERNPTLRSGGSRFSSRLNSTDGISRLNDQAGVAITPISGST